MQPRHFRPPYGRLRTEVAQALATRWDIVMWSVLTQDYDARLPTATVLRHATEGLSSGDILVFHDSTKAWPHLRHVLPAALAAYAAQGWQLAAL